jgi:hypothetical protein
MQLTRKGVMKQTISFYAQRDATADYRAHKQQNCVPRSTKAFRQHVESRVVRFLQEGHVFYRRYDPPIRLTQKQVADSYDTWYVATYNELQQADKVKPGDKVNWWIQQHRGGYGYTTPVAGIVNGETAKRVRIAIYNLRSREIEEKLVHPASLTSRTTHTELDDAMEQARGDAAS